MVVKCRKVSVNVVSFLQDCWSSSLAWMSSFLNFRPPGPGDRSVCSPQSQSIRPPYIDDAPPAPETKGLAVSRSLMPLCHTPSVWISLRSWSLWGLKNLSPWPLSSSVFSPTTSTAFHNYPPIGRAGLFYFSKCLCDIASVLPFACPFAFWHRLQGWASLHRNKLL